MTKPRVLVCSVLAMLLSVGLGLVLLNVWQTCDQAPPSLESPLRKLNDEFAGAVLPWLQLNRASLDEAVALLNRHADSSPAVEGRLRFAVWKEGEPVPTVLPVERDLDLTAAVPPEPPLPPLETGAETVIPGLEPLPRFTGDPSQQQISAPADPPPPMPPAGSGEITVSLKNIPLLEAARYISGLADRVMLPSGNTIYFCPKEFPSTALIHREFYLFGKGESVSGFFGVPKGFRGRQFDLRAFLTAQGVGFPLGSSAYYDPRSNMVAVELDVDNLSLVEVVLDGGCGGWGPSTAPSRLGRVKMQARYWRWEATASWRAAFWSGSAAGAP